MQNELENVILGMVAHAERETRENNAERIAAMKARFEADESLYDSEAALSYYSLATVSAIPFLDRYGVTDGKRKNVVKLIYGQVLPHFVRKRIERGEGWPYSGDKERFVIRKIKEYAATGENQDLYAEYPDEPGRQAYWSPRTFRDTDQVLEEFFHWYNLDNYGKTD